MGVARVRTAPKLVCLALFGLFLLQGPAAAQVKEVRRVLILDDLGAISSPGFAEINRAIFAALQKSPYQIEIYQESLELTLFPENVSGPHFRQQFIRKYSGHKPDVIITAGSASLKFISQLHQGFLRKTPIIFCAVLENIPETSNSGLHLTGVLGTLHPEETLHAALHLLPDTKHVVVVGGLGKFDDNWEAIAKQSFQKYESRLEFTYLTDLAMPALLERLKHLPPHTIVYHTAITEDAVGQHFVDSTQSVPLVAGAANAPVFVMDDVDLRGGAVGGDLVNWAEDARLAGEMAVRVLNGERPEDIPFVTSSDAYMFDWRALKRWSIKEADLPVGSIVLHRQPTLWEVYKWYIIAGIGLLFAQTMIIAGLVWQRTKRRETEAELKRSEEKFSKTFRHSPLGIAITRMSDSCILDINDTFEQQTGWSRNEVLGKSSSDFGLWVDTGQRAAFMEQLRTQGSVRNLEILTRGKDGKIGTMLSSGELIEVDGEPCALSVVADITERKLAEEALSTVSRKLIEAHEEERTWVARELHDDVNQRLALLAVNLDMLGREIPPSATNVLHHAADIKHQVKELGMDVQALSHRLHSSKLEYLGLSAAAGAFCREFSERKCVHIDFHSENIPRSLPDEICLCLFRILQEALQNAAKHSGSKNYQVSITFDSDELHLTISDSGSGFKMEDALKTPGLGITSMRERLKIVHGELRIDSQRDQGTVVNARVPFHAKTPAVHAAKS